MSWMQVPLILSWHIARATINYLLRLNTEYVEHHILNLVMWIFFDIPIRLTIERNKWEEVKHLTIVIDIL